MVLLKRELKCQANGRQFCSEAHSSQFQAIWQQWQSTSKRGCVHQAIWRGTAQGLLYLIWDMVLGNNPSSIWVGQWDGPDEPESKACFPVMSSRLDILGLLFVFSKSLGHAFFCLNLSKGLKNRTNAFRLHFLKI